jgi:L-ascorbate metabolism protein UlaG (beta-lactamase superfamily)
MPLKISRILHAGYVFECGDTQVAFDPIFENPFSVNCHAYPDVRFDRERIEKLRFSAVFISHYHDDHCSLESLKFLDRKTPLYLFCVFEELAELIRDLGFEKVERLELGKPVQIGPIGVTPLRALDAEVDSIFHIQAEGLEVLNVVDSWIDHDMLEHLAQTAPWDLILWPFQTMRELEVLAPTRAEPASRTLPPEWLDQLERLKPQHLVPSSCQFQMESWSWYNRAFFPISYQQFTSEISALLPETQIVRLNPSASITLNQDGIIHSTPLPWLEPRGEQNLDYDFADQLKVPSTAEIARHFPRLTSVQRRRAFDFCRTELPQKYGSLHPPEQGYFRKPRTWRLTVYDHEGTATHMSYALHDGAIEFCDSPDSTSQATSCAASWSTEIPLFKLWSALEEGESLTSLYIRINDCVFDPEIEKELHALELGDLMEDPLIRSLYEGKFATYQKAQLRRIRARD